MNLNIIQEMKATIPGINIQSIVKKDQLTEIMIEYPNTSDPRKDIFQYAVNQSWTILEMSASKRDLESIFRNLTQGSGAQDA